MNLMNTFNIFAEVVRFIVSLPFFIIGTVILYSAGFIIGRRVTIGLHSEHCDCDNEHR